ncbi:MAG: prepilin-type N-terminal cleavage/methylation domain-containing protein [Desulfomonilaceae bacterium]|nr:prepilin-type N-terminal cleavage/methylation domain-containing protein [Desulfomonilaceae bacterium]
MRWAGGGFTFTELMVVLLIIGVALAATVPYGVRWIADYKFSAGSRAFINAAQLARIKAIGGPITINVSEVDKGVDDSQLVFTVPAFRTGTSDTKTCSTCCDSVNAPPLKMGDYITVTGINNPDFLNGKIFLITNVPSPWTVTTTWDADSQRNWCDWDEAKITAKSCMENEPGNCIKLPSGFAGPMETTTGLIRVASCLRFVPFAQDDRDRVHFTVVKSGNSMECRYDPQWMDVKVLVPDPSNPTKGIPITDVTGAKPAPVVFDYAGATRNQMTYTVELRKMTRHDSGGTLVYAPVEDKTSPPIVFSIMPAGRVRLGSAQGSYADVTE